MKQILIFWMPIHQLPETVRRHYFFPGRAANYCYQCVCMSLCLYVRLSVRISQKQQVRTSRNFVLMLAVTEARSCFDDSAIGYVLPVYGRRYIFYLMGPIRQIN